jgi:hypothetical protein
VTNITTIQYGQPVNSLAVSLPGFGTPANEIDFVTLHRGASVPSHRLGPVRAQVGDHWSTRRR